MLAVAKSYITHHQFHLQPSGALPLAVPASAQVAVNLISIVVPAGQMWQVIGAGFQVDCDHGLLTVSGGTFACTPGVDVPEFDPAGGTPVPGKSAFRAPVIVNPINHSTTVHRSIVSLSLQGVELIQNDILSMQVTFTNADGAAAHNVTAIEGAIRYKPILIVSELGVAQIEAQRTDANLEARLRNRR